MQRAAEPTPGQPSPRPSGGDALVLSGQPMTAEGLEALHDRLIGTEPEEAARLSVLELEGCGLDEACAEPLARLANRLRGLRILNLAGNSLGTRGVAALMERLTAPLRVLLLARNGVGDGAARQLVSYLCYSRCGLETLDLAHNRLSDAFALLLARHLARAGVRALGLQFNDVTTAGARALAQALEAGEASVRSIDLRMNFVDPAALAPRPPPGPVRLVPGPGEARGAGGAEGESDTETVDSMDYTRADLRARMAARLRAIEARPEARGGAGSATFTQRILSLREVTRQLRASQLAARAPPAPPDPAPRSAAALLEGLRRRTGLGAPQ